MSQPGWYPDPAGQPGQFRYWDGSRWSQQTTATPQSSPPTAGATGPSRGGPGRILAVVAVVVVLALVAWLLVRSLGGSGTAGAKEDTNSSTPTVSAWDETSTPSPTPTPTDPDTGGSMVNCPDGTGGRGRENGDRLEGGGLSFQTNGWPRRWTGMNLPWLYEVASEAKSISLTWVSVSGVGGARRSDGFTDPKTAARMMMSCYATSGYYDGLTGRKQIWAKAVTIDGHPAFHIREEVYVDDHGPDIPGDLVDLIVVDTGDPEVLGVFLSCATIGDAATQAEVDRARSTLTVVR